MYCINIINSRYSIHGGTAKRIRWRQESCSHAWVSHIYHATVYSVIRFPAASYSLWLCFSQCVSILMALHVWTWSGRTRIFGRYVTSQTCVQAQAGHFQVQRWKTLIAFHPATSPTRGTQLPKSNNSRVALSVPLHHNNVHRRAVSPSLPVPQKSIRHTSIGNVWMDFCH